MFFVINSHPYLFLIHFILLFLIIDLILHVAQEILFLILICLFEVSVRMMNEQWALTGRQKSEIHWRRNWRHNIKTSQDLPCPCTRALTPFHLYRYLRMQKIGGTIQTPMPCLCQTYSMEPQGRIKAQQSHLQQAGCTRLCCLEFSSGMLTTKKRRQWSSGTAHI